MRHRLLLLILCLFLTSCNDFKAWYATEFRQDEVSSGIARLSAQHLSIMTNELGKRFKDTNVKTDIVPSINPQELGKGVVIKTIENMDMDYPIEAVIHEDCTGTKATWQGKLHVVKATLTIAGRLTNNPDNPIIPDSNGVSMSIRVKPEESTIKFSSHSDYLTLNQGEISFDAYPRFAQAQNGPLKGLRVIPTSNTRFENIVLRDVQGKLTSSKVTLPFNISDSNYLLQVGKGENGEENKIEGEVVSFGHKRKIPSDSSELSPDYQSEEFVKSYACKEGLDGVVDYKNVHFEEKLGPGLAGLTTLAMSKLATKLADDPRCGMASPEFLRSTKLVGAPGEVGSARATLEKPCRIFFDHYQTEPDCFGIAYEINGSAEVSTATKETVGLVFYTDDDLQELINKYEGDLQKDAGVAVLSRRPEPILPKSRQPATIVFDADLSDLRIREICIHSGSLSHVSHCSKNSDENLGTEFRLHAGSVNARLKPLMGKIIDPDDDRVHMCALRSIPIAEAEFALKSVNATIKKSGNEFQLFADGTYRTISGKIDDHENELSGQMTIGKIPVAFRSVDQDYIPLKPDYDARRFQDSYQSCALNKFVIPSSDEDCSLSELGL